MKQDLFQVDGKFYIRSKVVMLASTTGVISTKDYGHGKGLQLHNWVAENTKPQHLHFLSDERIKESGEWFYNYITNEVLKTDASNLIAVNLNPKNCKKIIATTDPKLTTKGRCNCMATTYEGCSECLSRLLRPSKSFLQKYVELGGIDEVLVELEITDCKRRHLSTGSVCDEDPNCMDWLTDVALKPKGIDCNHRLTLKVAPDDTITIKPVKQLTFTKEQAEALCIKAFNAGWNNGLKAHNNLPTSTAKEWTQKHL